MRGVIYYIRTMGWRWWLSEQWYGIRSDIGDWWNRRRS